MRLRLFAVWLLIFFFSGCAYQGGYNPTYVPDEEPDYISDGQALLVMSGEEAEFVYKGSPSSFTGGGTSLTIPLGFILKEVSEEVLRDRFSGGSQFESAHASAEGYVIGLRPSIERFDYKYNQLKNLGFAITPQIEVDLRVEIFDPGGNATFDQVYESGRVSGDTYMLSGSPGEKVNKLVHRVLYDLLVQSFADARSSGSDVRP